MNLAKVAKGTIEFSVESGLLQDSLKDLCDQAGAAGAVFKLGAMALPNVDADAEQRIAAKLGRSLLETVDGELKKRPDLITKKVWTKYRVHELDRVSTQTLSSESTWLQVFGSSGRKASRSWPIGGHSLGSGSFIGVRFIGVRHCVRSSADLENAAMAMLVKGYWADPFLDRTRTHVFSPTLDSMIDEDDPVRLVDEVLAEIDWSSWEAEYNGHRGQPPIHPRYIAGAMLYGMYRGIRSSRKLEEACHYRFDFIWLVEGRHIDHSTFAKFRTKFREPLKDLFRQIGRIAMALGLIRLGEVGFDGTRVKANNSRYKTLTAKTLEEKLQALDTLFEQMMAELQAMTPSKQGPIRPRTCPLR